MPQAHGWPQSAGQLFLVSPHDAWHTPLPQKHPGGQVWPQTEATSLTQKLSQLFVQQKLSTEQIWVTQGSQPAVSAPPWVHLSWAHIPPPQSTGQVACVSPQAGAHVMSPQMQFGGQSLGQVELLSPHWGWHWPLPQTHGWPQSCGQLALVSPH